MTITKQEVIELVKDLPDPIDVDDMIYRLYLQQKLAGAEDDVANNRVMPHGELHDESEK